MKGHQDTTNHPLCSLPNAMWLAITMLAVSTTNVEAGRRRVYRQSRQPVFTTNNGGGIFSRLMELERRKNAWLFGR